MIALSNCDCWSTTKAVQQMTALPVLHLTQSLCKYKKTCLSRACADDLNDKSFRMTGSPMAHQASANKVPCKCFTCWQVTHSVLVVVVAPAVAAEPAVTPEVLEAPATPELAPAPPDRLKTIWPVQEKGVSVKGCVKG